MNKTRTVGFLLCTALLLPAAQALAAAGNDENGRPGTVNYFNPAQKMRAFKAAAEAGYTPAIVAAFQDGNFFLMAGKGGERYEVTVLSSGQIYPGMPLTPTS